MLLAEHNSGMVCSLRPNETFPDMEQANSQMARRMLPPHQSCSHQQTQRQGGCGRFLLFILLIQVLIRMEPTEFEDRPATTAMLKRISDWRG